MNPQRDFDSVGYLIDNQGVKKVVLRCNLCGEQVRVSPKDWESGKYDRYTRPKTDGLKNALFWLEHPAVHDAFRNDRELYQRLEADIVLLRAFTKVRDSYAEASKTKDREYLEALAKSYASEW